jgi:hypothetical protein
LINAPSRFKTTIPDDLTEYRIKLTGSGNGLSAPSEYISQYKLVAKEDIEDEIIIQDNTNSTIDFLTDGIYVTTDGIFKVISTHSGKWHNPDEISTIEKFTDVDGQQTFSSLIEPEKLSIESSSTDEQTIEMERFGVKITHFTHESEGDVLVAGNMWNGEVVPTGKQKITEKSRGNTSIKTKTKETEHHTFDNLNWYFLHNHFDDSRVDSEWDMTDEIELEYDYLGGRTSKFSTNGSSKTTNSLETSGDHQWRYEVVHDSGPYTGLARNWGLTGYSSSGEFEIESTRNGSITTTFDPDGVALSASGNLQVVNGAKGNAHSEVSGWAKSVIGSESGGGFMAVALRDYNQNRQGSFETSQTTTTIPIVNSISNGGRVSLHTYSSSINGTKSGSQTTSDRRTVYEVYNGTITPEGNAYSVTDSGESPPGGGPSIVYLLNDVEFGNDPPPYENAPIIDSNGLGLFTSAFGYRSGFVTASFATAIPDTGSPPEPPTLGDNPFNPGNGEEDPDGLPDPGDENGMHDVLAQYLPVPPHIRDWYVRSLLKSLKEMPTETITEYLNSGIAFEKNGMVGIPIEINGSQQIAVYKYTPEHMRMSQSNMAGYGELVKATSEFHELLPATALGGFGDNFKDDADALYFQANLLLFGGLASIALVPLGASAAIAAGGFRGLLFFGATEIASEATGIPFVNPKFLGKMLGLKGKIDIGAYRKLRQELKDYGLADSASRKGLFRGQDVAFQRIDKFGDISGVVKLKEGKLSSIVAGVYGRDSTGNIVRNINAVTETGLPLLMRHRSLTNNLARKLGASHYELGGSIVQNKKIQHLMRRFEQRTTFSEFWGEEIFYFGKDYLVR